MFIQNICRLKFNNKVFLPTLLFLGIVTQSWATPTQAEKEQAELLQLVGYIAIGVVVAIVLIAIIWLLVLKKEKDGKIKVKAYSASDKYTKKRGIPGGGNGFLGGW